MRDFIGEVHRAIDRVNDPALFRRDVSGLTLFPQHSDFWKCPQQFALNELLAFDIEFELDVVLGHFVGFFGRVAVFSHQGAGGTGSSHGGGESTLNFGRFHRNEHRQNAKNCESVAAMAVGKQLASGLSE